MKTSLFIFCFFVFQSIYCQTKSDTVSVLNILLKNIAEKLKTNDHLSGNALSIHNYRIIATTFAFTKPLLNECNMLGFVKNGIDTFTIQQKLLQTKVINIDNFLQNQQSLEMEYSTAVNRYYTFKHKESSDLKNKETITVQLSTPIFIENQCLIFMSSNAFVVTYLFNKTAGEWQHIDKK